MKSEEDLNEELEKLCKEEFTLETKNAIDNVDKLEQIRSRIQEIALQLDFDQEELEDIKAYFKDVNKNKGLEITRSPVSSTVVSTIILVLVTIAWITLPGLMHTSSYSSYRKYLDNEYISVIFSVVLIYCIYIYRKKHPKAASPILSGSKGSSHEIVRTYIVGAEAFGGVFKLSRQYPIRMMAALVVSGLIAPIYLAMFLVPHVSHDDRQTLAKVSLILAVILPALFMFYLYHSSIHEITVDKGKDIYIKTKNGFEKLQISQFKYVRLYTYQRRNKFMSIPPTPTMIVFSNIKNDYTRSFLGTYFPFIKSSIVLPIYKIKSQNGNLKAKPYVLGNLVKKLCKNNGFTIQIFENTMMKSDGWLAERNSDATNL